MFNKLKNFVQNKQLVIKTLVLITCVLTTLACSTCLAFADDTTATPGEIIQGLLNVIFDIAGYIGVLLLAWGGITLFLAIRNEDADSKSRAVMLLVVAIGLICFGAIFGEVIKLTGYNVN